MPTSLIPLVAGLLLLFVGGELVVRGAMVVALLARLSTAVIGLTIVAMGTSFPELAVSLDAAARGSTVVAYSNVVGSNIFNVTAILGIAALLRPIPVRRQVIRIEYPFMLAVTGIGIIFARDGVIDRPEGILLVVGLIGFTAFVLRLARRAGADDDAPGMQVEVERAAHVKSGALRAWGFNLALLVVGIACLGAGAELAVSGGLATARAWGMTERVLGITVIAMGTSLPELATSVAAARRGDLGIALGNVIGSNIFNIMGILGITSLIVPITVPSRAIVFDNWAMLGIAAALTPLMVWRRSITWWKGALLLAGFATYMAYVLVTG